MIAAPRPANRSGECGMGRSALNGGLFNTQSFKEPRLQMHPTLDAEPNWSNNHVSMLYIALVRHWIVEQGATPSSAEGLGLSNVSS